MKSERVILISNDVVPGFGMPVAAPGLRVFGLASGLRAHGMNVEVVVVQSVVRKLWRGATPPASAEGTVTVDSSDLVDYLRQRTPGVAILTNSNQVPFLQPIEGIRYVLDFFAPKMLELSYQYEGAFPGDELKVLRQRKIDAIQLAEGFIVNGPKKLPYFLAWLLQGDRDIRSLPVEVVNMCLPIEERAPNQPDTPRRFGVAGYLQGWSSPGPWFDVLLGLLDNSSARLDLLMPVHWGQPDGSVDDSRLAGATKNPHVTIHQAMPFSAFRDLVGTFDVAIDLFRHTLEREYAVVTRTVVALSCGVPVVHPPFTEVSPWIDEYDAGWLIDPEDLKGLESALTSIIEDPELVRSKSANASKLAAQMLDPKTAVEPLVRLIGQFS